VREAILREAILESRLMAKGKTIAKLKSKLRALGSKNIFKIEKFYEDKIGELESYINDLELENHILRKTNEELNAELDEEVWGLFKREDICE
jgi:predicted RNase H-like nuclease (RuvC/YqgF family)